MLPTLRQLQYFKALAEHLSFSKAAEACHITQSTLSASIRQLEDNLECALVDRSGKQLVLTETGEKVLAQSAALLRDAEELVQGVKAQHQPLTGRFRLGVIPSISPFVLPRFLPGLREAFPALKLYLREDLTRNLLSSLREGRIDAALIAFPYELSGFDFEIVGEDAFLLAVPAEHPLAAREEIALEELGNERLLLLEDGHCLRNHVLAATKGRLAGGEEDIQATSLITLVQMVDNGLGVTLLPKLAAEAGVTGGTGLRLIRLKGARSGRQLGVVWRRKSSFEKNARLMAGELAMFLAGEGAG
ncbi:hydrogen peroxide-inducible genes activator [Polycladidibacter hongkongensis]|uniref:hydrogen peroxide-inducible genes activator n=1 Tax=Polycladidibacter hongkongensis TaxID=1647556 RepID=UPI0008299C24|nr:hydrogen peroxide-inducible genes activator [Pseudovibrio hongkongensis]